MKTITEQQREAIEKAGYKIISLMQGGYIAQKFQRKYKAESIRELYNQIFN